MSKVAVCLLAHNESEDVVLRSVEAVRRCEGVTVDELVLIANGPAASALPGLVRRFPELRAVRIDENLGIAVSRNLALDVTRSPLVFFVDAHMVLARDALAIACAELEAGACAVFGTYRTRGRDGQLTHRDLLYSAFAGKRDRREPLVVSHDRFVGMTGGICGVSRQHLDGLRFDTEFALTSMEDIHFQLRLLRRGSPVVYLPGMVADHLHPSSLRGLARKRLKDARAYALLRRRGAKQDLVLPRSRYLFPAPLVPLAALLCAVTRGALRRVVLAALGVSLGREVLPLVRAGGLCRSLPMALLDRVLWQCGTLAAVSPLGAVLRPPARTLPATATVSEADPESERFVPLGLLVRDDQRHDYVHLLEPVRSDRLPLTVVAAPAPRVERVP
ncbi:glycosyltransferase [Actinosynnema sp. NPDC023587]|uniref:glycosyltransferase n=1 Tax=Actinosynnema sp. NPDC023587 TaxID=3154695 RepID=UPI0033CB4BE3